MAERDVERALALQPAHISHYQLTLEPEHAVRRAPAAGLPDDDASWDMQEHCQARARGRRLRAVRGHRLRAAGRRCAHNLNYWHFGDYLGIGAGAHGKLTLGASSRCCGAGRSSIRPTISSRPGTPARSAAMNASTAQRRPFDYMLNALRLVDGFASAEFEPRTGLPRDGDRAGTATRAAGRGWITQDAAVAFVRPNWAGASPTTSISLFLAD